MNLHFAPLKSTDAGILPHPRPPPPRSLPARRDDSDAESRFDITNAVTYVTLVTAGILTARSKGFPNVAEL